MLRQGLSYPPEETRGKRVIMIKGLRNDYDDDDENENRVLLSYPIANRVLLYPLPLRSVGVP